MRFVGIDIGSEVHAVGAVDEAGSVVLRKKTFRQDAEGYERLREWLGSSGEAVVGLEATGHYWQNLAAWLFTEGYSLVVLNPLRTRRFAETDLARTKTDAIDALGIARFLQEKRPAPTPWPDETQNELRELMRLRDRFVQDLGDRTRQLRRGVDLAFPEFVRHVSDLSTAKATGILLQYPTAQAFKAASEGELANLRAGRYTVGRALAKALIDAAKVSVGAHQSEPYALQIRCFCEDIDTLRKRIESLDGRIKRLLDDDSLGALFTSIPGLGPNSAARIIAELGDPSHTFDSASALAAYVGVVPALRHSGKHTPKSAPCTRFGNAKLRAKLWMPTLAAVRHNPWLKAHYERLVSNGKPRKVALVACLRKLLTAIYSVAKNRKPFVPKMA